LEKKRKNFFHEKKKKRFHDIRKGEKASNNSRKGRDIEKTVCRRKCISSKEENSCRGKKERFFKEVLRVWIYVSLATTGKKPIAGRDWRGGKEKRQTGRARTYPH